MENKRLLLIFVCSLFIVGFIFGSLAVLFMPSEQEVELSNYLNELFDRSVYQVRVPDSKVIWDHSMQYLLIGFLIIFMGFFVIGVPIVLLYIFIKGTLLGFTSTFIISQMGGKGVLFIVYYVLPQNLLLVPTLLFFAVYCVAYALFIINNRIFKFQGKLNPLLVSYVTYSLGLLAALVIVAIYESTIAPYLMERMSLLS